MANKNNNFLFWLIAIIAIILLTLGMVKLASIPKDNNSDGVVAVATVNQTDQIKGNIDAPVTIIEYSDFQCPFCAESSTVLKNLISDMGEQVRLVYRHFPLKTIHANSEAASMAAEAAGLQNKFWEMHDLLFTNQTIWSGLNNPQDTFIQYADELGLDTEKFTADLNDQASKNKIQADLSSGNQAGVQGTPTLFINGQKINTPRTYNELVNEVNKYINQ